MNKDILLLLIAFAITKKIREITAEKPDQSMKDGIDKLYKRQNELRAKHGVDPLSVDSEIEKIAQSHVEKLASNNMFELSGAKFNEEELGENLYLMMSSGDPTFTGIDVANHWYEEGSKYDFNNPGYVEKQGHFTQIVWKSSKKIGCGVAKGPYNFWNGLFVDCLYFPAGNINNATYFKNNVFPSKY